jgi:hypothetical protein
MTHLVYEVAKAHVDDLHREAAAARRAALATGPPRSKPWRQPVWRPRLAFIRHGLAAAPARARPRFRH